MLARYPLLHLLAMAALAVLVAMLFWNTFTEYLSPLVAAVFALPIAVVFLKMPREPSPERNRGYVMAWVLFIGMLVVFTFLSSGAL